MDTTEPVAWRIDCDDCVMHGTRHTFCTRLGESGCDAFTIMRLAGHSSIVISQKYVHPTPALLENAIGKLTELNTKKQEKEEKDGAGHRT